MAAPLLQTFISKIVTFNTKLNAFSPCTGALAACTQQVRWKNRNKHYDPKWRRHRWAKYVKIELPNFDDIRRDQNSTPGEKRAKMKKDGQPPPRTYKERKLLVASTGGIFEKYVPPEGDGLASLLSGERAKQAATGIDKKRKSYMETKKIRKYDEDFDPKTFGELASDIYIEAHEALNNFKENEEKLHDLVTEMAFPQMTYKLDKTTARWKFIESLEPPRVVHVRTTSLMASDNMFGQVTVRFHTKQTLALYDRFGRLMFGSEDLIKNCLEYVVFEKYLSDEYGKWRIHAKLKPNWLPGPEPVARTIKKPTFVDEDTSEQGKEAGQQAEAAG